MILHILKDEVLISPKHGPVRLQSGSEINPSDLGFDEVTINSLIGRGIAREAVLIVAPVPEPVDETETPKEVSKPAVKKSTRKK